MSTSVKNSVVLATPGTTSHRTAEENLGLGYLARMLRDRGINVVVIDAWLEGLSPRQLADRITEVDDLLWYGFACYGFNSTQAIETTNLVKQKLTSVPAVVGGFGPTFQTQYFLESGFDYVVRGEAELTVLALTDRLQGKDVDSVPGAAYHVDGRVKHDRPAIWSADLDSYPFPCRDYTTTALQRGSAAHISTARGCNAHCLFCSINAFQTKASAPRWRSRSIESIVAELVELQALGARHIKVVDDSFIEPPRDGEWCTRFADAIEANGLDLTMWTYLRADRVDEHILSELKRAGFQSYFVGVENFSQRVLDRWSKPATVEQNHEALRLLRKLDYVVQGGMILFDSETVLDELEENYEAYRQYPWLVTKGAFTELYAAEGTPWTKILNRRTDNEPLPLVGQNYVYSVRDEAARAVYDAMKRWHVAHQPSYDKAIDPLAAPKAINREQMRSFEPALQRLRELDLDFMRKALDLARREPSSAALLEMEAEEEARTAPVFAAVDAEVDVLYQDLKLVYDADPNPFLIKPAPVGASS
ncbi:B12-binding domain-containing radical SAM protein [Micromonospora peucetia]|uniref:B12-binding domain-containing radical SAM protein n=1 Tax=Micromonospora peucetia TaxID=47871 RepID=A0A1C6UL27_9ACTN|nr:radical SAM protein [Micromonospora peucetia]MCX4386953.1 B12-binding domain-containing radical SAM protein [Micromonospora peucetia]WSA34323.1 B12-binding domain-containing radical SAM protein [Micromonospora peucetia]SCL54662.1 Radical SAM superfamily enzyme YgiQ, UPF0313 family [Micromonospora peucetia]